jgi:hypothetical protein
MVAMSSGTFDRDDALAQGALTTMNLTRIQRLQASCSRARFALDGHKTNVFTPDSSIMTPVPNENSLGLDAYRALLGEIKERIRSATIRRVAGG